MLAGLIGFFAAVKAIEEAVSLFKEIKNNQNAAIRTSSNSSSPELDKIKQTIIKEINFAKQEICSL